MELLRPWMFCGATRRERAMAVTEAILSPLVAYKALQEAIRKEYPYELPEVIAVTIDKGLAEFLAWIDRCVEKPS